MILSIITINYNNLLGLRKTIDSVISQSWQEFEWIIIDGGSTDGSKELIEETAASCPCISFWCSEPDKGIYNAMNKGIDHAFGDYCLFLNSGDYLFTKDTLYNVIRLNLDKDICYGHALYNENDSLKPIWKAPQRLNYYFFINSSFCHQAVFIKRSLFMKIGYYDEKFKIAADRMFFIDAILYNKVSYKRLDIGVCGFEGGGVSETMSEQLQKELSLIRNNLQPELLEKELIKAKSFDEINSNYLFRSLYALLYRAATHFNPKN